MEKLFACVMSIDCKNYSAFEADDELFFGTEKEAKAFFETKAKECEEKLRSVDGVVIVWYVFDVTDDVTFTIEETEEGSGKFRRLYKHVFGDNSEAWFFDKDCVMP